MSLKSHALHHISIITIWSCILDVCNWLCAGRIGLGWANDAIYFACHMFMHFPCICTPFQYLLYLNCFGAIMIVSFSLPLFLLTLVVSMIPKRKSTLAQNPLRSKASSSSASAPISLCKLLHLNPWVPSLILLCYSPYIYEIKFHKYIL